MVLIDKVDLIQNIGLRGCVGTDAENCADEEEESGQYDAYKGLIPFPRLCASSFRPNNDNKETWYCRDFDQGKGSPSS